MSRPRSWTDEQLIEAVAKSHTLVEVLERLGLRRGGATLHAVRNRMRQLGLDPPRPDLISSPMWSIDLAMLSTAPPPGRSWSDAELAWAVATSFSMAQVIGALGLNVGGSVYQKLRKQIADLGLDTSHWTRQGWAKGRKLDGSRRGRPLHEILVEDSDYLDTHRLKRRLLEAGLFEWRCQRCRRTEWEGHFIPLQLDHINGNRTDNRLENLRLLCPNCHSLTDTWCGKNIGRYRSAN